MGPAAPALIFIGKIIVTSAISYGLSYAASALSGKKQSRSQSPAYGFGPMTTQLDSTLSVPIIYGYCKSAGYLIYQKGNDSPVITKLVSFCDGKINNISNLKLNDIAINELSGCSYNAYYGDGLQIVDDRVPGANLLDKINVVGALKYDAYVAITAHASEKLNSDFNVTAEIEGSFVRVYSDINTYTEKYSNNPAWCILDFLTRDNACNIDYSKIDIQSFIEAASYCDYEVTPGQKRFTLNLILDQKKSNRDWLAEMVSVCQGSLIDQNGKYILRIEKPEDVSQVYLSKHINDVNVWWSPLEDEFEVVRINHPSPENNWTKIDDYAVASIFSRPNQPNIKEITINGITNSNQASRLASFELNKAQKCKEYISFITNKRMINNIVYDVISITYEDLDIFQKKYRIIEIQDTQNNQGKIIAREYHAEIYNDAIGNSTPVTNLFNKGNAFAAPPTITGLSISEIGWLNKDGVHISNIDATWDKLYYQFLSYYVIKYSEDNGFTWKDAGIAYDNYFRIKNVKTNSNYKVSIQAVNHKNIMSNQVYSSQITIIGKDQPPDDVAGFNYNLDPYDSTKINLYWNDNSDTDLKGYELREGDSWSSEEIIATNIPINSYTFVATASSSKTFLLKAIDNSGNYSSNPAILTINITVEPPDVLNFLALQNGPNSLLKFDKSLSPDVIGYEIREGSTFDLGLLVVTGLTNSEYQIPVDTEKVYRYWIKAINRAGFYSKNAAYAEVEIINLPPRNIINTYDELTLQNGNHSNTVFATGTINCSNLGDRCSDWTALRCNQVGGATVLKLAQNGSVYYANGNYTVTRKDMGEVITASLSSQFVSNALLGSDVNAKLQFRTSVNGTIFTDWKDFAPILATFRYVDFKILLETFDTSISPEVVILKESIDVPDVDKYGTSTIEVGGSTIDYEHTYYQVPYIGITVIGSGLKYEMISRSNTSFNVKVLNSFNVDVGGQITWHSKGY